MNAIPARGSFLSNARKALGGLAPFLALIILSLIIWVLKPQFMTGNNLMNITRQAAPNALISLGMMVSILTAGIDLSVGSTMALASIVMAKFITNLGFSGYAGIVICLLAGALLGLINGLLLTVVKLPHPFISTLGTQNIYRGVCLILTMATPISPMPEEVNFLGSADLFGIPVCLILTLVAYMAFSVFLNRTLLGRHIYAVGGNFMTAKLSGVNTNKTLTLVYTISGLMCGFAGLVVVGRTNSAAPLAGLACETDAIAAVIIGGASFFGGRGKIIGTFSGVLLIAVLRNGLNLLNISADAQTVIIGLVIILAVSLDVARNGGYKKIKKINLPADKESRPNIPQAN
jgi:ribose transport system permease protein